MALDPANGKKSTSAQQRRQQQQGRERVGRREKEKEIKQAKGKEK